MTIRRDVPYVLYASNMESRQQMIETNLTLNKICILVCAFCVSESAGKRRLAGSGGRTLTPANQ